MSVTQSTLSDNTLSSCLNTGDVVECRKLLEQGVKWNENDNFDFGKIFKNCPTDNPQEYAKTMKVLLDTSSFAKPLNLFFENCKNLKQIADSSSGAYRIIDLFISLEKVVDALNKTLKGSPQCGHSSKEIYSINILICTLGEFVVGYDAYYIQLLLCHDDGRGSIKETLVSEEDPNDTEMLTIFESLYGKNFSYRYY